MIKINKKILKLKSKRGHYYFWLYRKRLKNFFLARGIVEKGIEVYVSYTLRAQYVFNKRFYKVILFLRIHTGRWEDSGNLTRNDVGDKSEGWQNSGPGKILQVKSPGITCYTLMITESSWIAKNLSPTLLSAAYFDTICGTTLWPILSRVGDSDAGDDVMFAILWW